MKRLMDQNGDKNVVRRCMECKPDNVSISTALQAKALLDLDGLEKIQRFSKAVVSFCTWVSKTYSSKKYRYQAVKQKQPSKLKIQKTRQSQEMRHK